MRTPGTVPPLVVAARFVDGRTWLALARQSAPMSYEQLIGLSLDPSLETTELGEIRSWLYSAGWTGF